MALLNVHLQLGAKAMGTGLSAPQIAVMYDTKHYPPFFNLIHCLPHQGNTAHLYWHGYSYVCSFRDELVSVLLVASLSSFLFFSEAKAIRECMEQCWRGVSINQQELIRRGQTKLDAVSEFHSANWAVCCLYSLPLQCPLLHCFFQKPDLRKLLLSLKMDYNFTSIP